MTNLDKVTGQVIDYKEMNDNAPPSGSAPSSSYKDILKYHSNKHCNKCNGTGYIGSFKHIAAGRCFQCLPDDYWGILLGELKGTGIDDNTKESVCEIRYVTKAAYSEAGFGVFKVGVPPIGEFELFPTYEEAVEFAKKHYNI